MAGTTMLAGGKTSGRDPIFSAAAFNNFALKARSAENRFTMESGAKPLCR